MKWIAPISVISVFLNSVLCAASLNDRVDALDTKMQSIYLHKGTKQNGVQFTQTNLTTPWTITAQLLYWTSYVEAPEYAMTFNELILPLTGKFQDSDYRWNWGACVGIGRKLPHYNWDFGIFYTHFNTSDKISARKVFGSSLLPHYQGSESGSINASIHTSLRYDTLDVMFARQFFVSKSLTFNPAIGMKTGWISQKDTLRSNTRIDAPNSSFAVSGNVISSIKSTSRFWNIGPQIGTAINWFMGCGFSFLTEISGTLLFSEYNIRNKQKTRFAPDGTSETVITINVKAYPKLFIPQTRLFTGLSWEKPLHFKQKKQRIALALGYEVQYFWRAVQFLNPLDTTPSPISTLSDPFRIDFVSEDADMAFYGVTLKASFNF